MKRLTDGVREILLGEQERDAREMERGWDTEADYCPLAGDRPYPSLPAVADDDDDDDYDSDDDEGEETELDYLPGEWREIGCADGSMGGPCRPPAEDERRRAYEDGWAVGRLEWAKVRDAEPDPQPGGYASNEDIPF